MQVLEAEEEEHEENHDEPKHRESSPKTNANLHMIIKNHQTEKLPCKDEPDPQTHLGAMMLTPS